MKLLTLTLANIFFVSASTKLDSNVRALADEDVKSDTVSPTGPTADGSSTSTTTDSVSDSFSSASATLTPGVLLQEVVDDEGITQYWIMAPKPGYDKFDLGKDELMILSSDAPESASAGVVKAEFWNIGGDRFNTDTCEMTLTDSDADTYWDSFVIAADLVNCPTYGGKTGLIQYIL